MRSQIIILFFLFTMVFGQDTVQMTIQSDSVWIKQESDIFSKKGWRAYKNDTIVVYKEIVEIYFKIKHNNRIGWISHSYVRPMSSELRKYWDTIKPYQPTEPLLTKKERLQKKYGSVIANKISRGQIWIGMTDDMARNSMGRPDDINKTVNRWGVSEQWIYDKKDMYLYFDDGILTSWQE